MTFNSKQTYIITNLHQKQEWTTFSIVWHLLFNTQMLLSVFHDHKLQVLERLFSTDVCLMGYLCLFLKCLGSSHGCVFRTCPFDSNQILKLLRVQHNFAPGSSLVTPKNGFFKKSPDRVVRHSNKSVKWNFKYLYSFFFFSDHDQSVRQMPSLRARIQNPVHQLPNHMSGSCDVIT